MRAGARRSLLVWLTTIALLAGCGSAAQSPTPITTSGPTAHPAPATPPSVAPALTAPSPHRVWMAPGPDGGLYVLVVDEEATAPSGPGSRSILALLDAQGRPRAGWPIALVGWACIVWDWYWPLPVTAADGSVRLICSAITSPGEPVRNRAFAFDPRARPLAGWPVDLPGPISEASVVGDSLVVMAQEVDEWDETTQEVDEWDETTQEDSGVWWLITVARDGTLRVGEQHEVPDAEGYGFPELGPEGIAYQLARVDTGTKIRTLAVDSDGRVSPVASGSVPVGVLDTYSGAGPPTGPAVVVAADGAVFLLSEDEWYVYGLDPAGQIMAGWPYQPAAPQYRGSCREGEDTGCGDYLATPAVGPGDVLYLPQARGRLVAIDPDGGVRPGWPVVLTRPGAAFWSVVVGSDGTAFALAVEPEAGDRSSATILAIAPDGSVRYGTTVVDP